MKHLMIVTVFASMLLAGATVGAEEITTSPWTGGTAYTLPEGRLEVGFFGPIRYGFRDHVEVTTHPVWATVIPNLSVKVAWGGGQSGQLATRHGLVYPTPLLRLLSRSGTGGVLPEDAQVPHIIALQNEVITSHMIGGGHLFTWSLGATVAAEFGESDWPTIDMPFVFPRTSAFQNMASGQVGVSFLGPLVGPYAYTVQGVFFFLPGTGGAYGVEQGSSLTWNVTPGFILQAGYRFAWGSYPFGRQFDIYPTADVKWGWD